MQENSKPSAVPSTEEDILVVKTRTSGGVYASMQGGAALLAYSMEADVRTDEQKSTIMGIKAQNKQEYDITGGQEKLDSSIGVLSNNNAKRTSQKTSSGIKHAANTFSSQDVSRKESQ